MNFHAYEFEDYQAQITEWQRETFGTPDQLDVLNRTEAEFEELIEAVHDQKNRHEIGREIADVFVMLCQLADSVGVDIETAVREVMERNLEREWNVDERGIGQHVEKTAYRIPITYVESASDYVDGDPDTTLWSAFVWNDTPQGHEYWSDRSQLSFSELDPVDRMFILEALGDHA